MKKVLYITASDIHFADWGQFNKDGRRITAHLDVWSQLEALCKKYRCPLLMPGDMFHNPKHLSNRLLNMVLPRLIDTQMSVLGISGNHDQDGISTPDRHPNTYMTLLDTICPNIHNLDYLSAKNGDIRVWGIPYITHNIGFKETIEGIKFKKGERNILMIHTDLPGALDTSGREVGTAEGITAQYSKLFSRFDLVLAGHIHKPQQLASNVIMVGAPQQQNRGDRNCEFGYWKIYEDLTFEFFEIESPKFKTAKSKDEIDDYNYWDINSEQDNSKEDESPKKRKRTEQGAIDAYLKETGVKKVRAKALKKILNKAKND